MTKPVLLVAGPTASGKSGLALELAERFRGVVINADSMQVYRELQILTARPGTAALARAPHRLYGVLPAAEACSAGRWHTLALAEIAAAHAAERLPILVGGTGLYLKVLVEGIAALPPVPEAIRQAARQRYEALGPEGFRAALAARDPLAAARLAPADRQRLTRAWEVLEATGRSLVLWQHEARAVPPTALNFAALLLEPARAALYAACERRFDGMVAEGALDEVRVLLALGLPPHAPIMRAVGVPELAHFLAGELGLAQAIADAKLATRRLAKRQTTWFRNQPLAPMVLTLDGPLGAQFSESFKERIFNFVCQFLLTEEN